MNEIKRLTLVSDPTNEFPNNANNSFKVRLPERLVLPGAGWHASLMSLTVPDQGQSNAVIAADPHTKVLKFKMTYVIRKFVLNSYRRVETKTVDCEVELEEIMNANQIVATGSMFWQRVMQEVNNKIMHNVMKEQIQNELCDPQMGDGDVPIRRGENRGLRVGIGRDHERESNRGDGESVLETRDARNAQQNDAQCVGGTNAVAGRGT